MSTPYIRRPALEGNTDVPVQSQPYLQGTIRKTSTGTVPGFAALVATANADFVVESEAAGGGPVTVTFVAGHSDLLTDIVDKINTDLFGIATAEERDGCLRLQTVGVGETVSSIKSFIRVHPATTDYDADGVPNDCAAVFGFSCYPDPAATAQAGDVESAATRPVEQANPPGTKFIARGEDRTSSAFNRALSQLALNADILRTASQREAYYPVSLTIDISSTNWDVASGRLRFDGSGRVTQIKLSDLEAVDATLGGRLYVGGLSRSSSLRQISKYWGVTDSTGNELAVYDADNSEIRTLRVGAVTRGETGFGRPSFVDEDSAPTILFPNTANITPDGGNALGLYRVKSLTAAITEVRNRTNVVCSSLSTPSVVPTTPTSGVGFLTSGIVRGDVALIADATVTSPFCHNGPYYVEDVVSEQELILRPLSDTDVEALNPSNSGSFGTITVFSSGEWSSDIWVTLDPPLSRFPEDNKIVLTFGIERETVNQRQDVNFSYTDTSAVERSPSDPQLTGFQAAQFWQRQSLGGAYAGMSASRTSDAGSIIKTRTRPVTVIAPEKTVPSAGTYVRGPFTGTLVGDGILFAESAAVPPHPDSFTLGDVGRVVKLSGGAFIDAEPFLITEFIDGAHVRLAPLGAEPGVELSTYGSVSYEVYDDVVDYPGSIISLIAPEEDREGTALSDLGVLYIRDQNSASGPPSMPTRQHGRSLLHLERVSVGYITPGSAVSIRSVVITGTTATTVTIGLSVESFQNIFAVEGGDTRPVEAPYNGGSVFRIINGPNAGYYLVQKTTSSNELTLRTLEGDSVLLDTGVTTTQIGAFYNAHVSVGHKLAGTGYGDVAYRTAKLRVFFDSLEQGEEAGVGLSLDWRGQGAGISAQLNDADFIAYDSEAGASGYFLDVSSYVPVSGIVRASLTADITAADQAKRSAKAQTVWTATNNVDFVIDAATEGDWRAATPDIDRPDVGAWNTWLHQEGSDSALVVTRGATNGDASLPVAGEDLLATSRAALVVQELSSLRSPTWGALDVVGGVYQYQIAEGQPGLHTDAGVAAGSWVVPGYRRSSEVFNPEEHASLGLPAVVYAYDGSTSWVEKHAPDFSKFAVPHMGIYVFGNHFWATSVEALNGLLIRDSAEAEDLKIVAVYFDEGSDELWVAVDGRAAVRPTAFVGTTTVISPETVEVIGRRWDHGYVDIAEFTRIGTAVRSAGGSHISDATAAISAVSGESPAQERQAPLLGIRNPFSAQSLTDVAYASPWDADMWPHAQFVLHPASLLFGLSVEGPHSPWYAGESLTGDDSYNDNYRTTAAAFPNQAVISNYGGGTDGVEIDGILYPRTLNDLVYGGNLGNHDFCLYAFNTLYDFGVSATWDTAYGGSVRVYVAQDSLGNSPTTGTTPHVTWLLQRGVANISRAAGHYRAFARIAFRHRTTGVEITDPNDLPTIAFAVVGSDNQQFFYNLAYEGGLTVLDEAAAGPVYCWRMNFQFTGADNEVGTFAGERSETPLEDAFHVGLVLRWGLGDDEVEAFVLDLGVEQLTPPAVIEAPLQVTGPVVGTNFLFSGTKRGFVAASPSEIGWLNSSEFFQYRFSSSAPSQNGYYFSRLAAHMGVGSLQVTKTFNSTSGLPETSATVRPMPASSSLFSSGVYGATFRTLQPFYDPLWYIQGAATAEGDFSTSDGRFSPCGPTGFVIPVDVPHGARITGIDLVAEVTKSILAWCDPLPTNYTDPVTDPNNVGMTYQFFVPDTFDGIGDWNDVFADTSTNLPLLKQISKWQKGFRVRLWRYRNVGVNASKWGDPLFVESAGREIRAGWPESIWSRVVALDNTVNTDPGDVVPEPELLDLSWDLFRDGSSDVATVDTTQFAALTADRRNYAYFFTIEFYAGARTIKASTNAQYQGEFAYYFQPVSKFFGGSVGAPTLTPQSTRGGTGWYYNSGFDVHEVMPGDDLDSVLTNYKEISVESTPTAPGEMHTSAAYVPGTFTVRGFRLTYETDKPRH